MTGRIVTPGPRFRDRASVALGDAVLQDALRNLDVRLHSARDAQRALPGARERASLVRREWFAEGAPAIDRLSEVLTARGAQVHRAATPTSASRIVVDLARRAGARTVVKSKSMASEEVDLADALEAAGVEVVESDLGEYIVQVADERPSHMITPAIHKTLQQIADVLGSVASAPLPREREALAAWSREHLRGAFLRAEMGVTGANFVAADTGTIVLVTNEGNGRLTTTLPRVLVCVVPVEKIVPRLTDLATLLPLLTRSATGQTLSNYVTMLHGPRAADEVDGPQELHVVLLDHHRLRLLGTPYEEMLACIRCGACLNVCPVYRAAGGHAYDAVYPGPMGSVLTPLLSVGAEGADLPSASTLCGACAEACPVGIPLADLLVRLRADQRAPGVLQPRARRDGDAPAASAPLRSRRPRRSARHAGYALWSRAWASPTGYRATTAIARTLAGLLARDPTALRPVPGLGAWAAGRALPVPAPRSFRQRWRDRGTGGAAW